MQKLPHPVKCACGHISEYDLCRYCGTRYAVAGNSIMNVTPSQAVVYQQKFTVRKDVYPSVEVALHHLKKEAVSMLAEEIIKHTDFITLDSVESASVDIKTTVRILPDAFCFSDAPDVRHGYWSKYTKSGYFVRGGRCCSVCDLEVRQLDSDPLYPRCPYCGAIMDELPIHP